MIAGAAVEVAIAAIVGVGGYARLDGIAQSIENGDAVAFRHDHLVVEALRHGLEAEAGGADGDRALVGTLPSARVGGGEAENQRRRIGDAGRDEAGGDRKSNRLNSS